MNLDGYKSPDDWFNKHAGLFPSDNLHRWHHLEYNDEITSYQVYEETYTPRPSFSRQLPNLDIEYILEDSYLSEIEMKVLRGIYIDNKTQIEIGSQLGLSQGWVSRLKSKAIDKLKKKLN